MLAIGWAVELVENLFTIHFLTAIETEFMLESLIFFVTIVQLFVEQIRHPEDTYSLMLEEEETLEKLGGITI